MGRTRVRVCAVRVSAVLAAVVVLLAGTACTPPPAPTASVPPSPGRTASQLVVGMDELATGFNPHLLAHVSPTTTALATLVLPSVFRPAADGSMQLDRTIANSAQVVSQQPFTVTYELNLKAAWSNNAPIAAEDFVYLWERMQREPGVTDAAGYRLIAEVRSRAGGKAVDVVFSQPYPAWQQLFANLLPAHLLKDAPGSWTGALTSGIPVSGGPFRIQEVDRARGEIVLARNDAYWDTPAGLDRLVLRRTDTAGLVDGLRSGEIPIALPRADPAVMARLAELGSDVKVQGVPQPVVVGLGLRADAGPLVAPRLRVAIGAMLDRDALILQGGGAPPASVLRTDAHVLAPSQPGYLPTIPPGPPTRPDPKLVAQLLTEAGYTRDTAGRWSAGGVPLQITVGAPTDSPLYQRVAGLVRDQLAAAGVAATVIAAPATELFTQQLVQPAPPTTAAATPSAGAAPTSAGPDTTRPRTPELTGPVRVDLMVLPRTVGGDPATELASDYGCPVPTPVSPDPPPGPTGYCFPALQPLLDAALVGTVPAAQAIPAAERSLWAQLPSIPLFQVVTALAVSNRAVAATGIGPGPLVTGPLTGAQRWRPLAG